MLIDTTAHLPIGLALLDNVFHAPTASDFAHILVRWLHFVGGITWIGMLYFFNLVNVPLQKKLDPDTKKKVNPDLLLPALWFFRWGAVLTVLAGLTYYAMFILTPDVTNANNAGAHLNVWLLLIEWLTYPIVLFIIEFLIIKKVPALIKDGRVFAIVAIILISIVTFGIMKFFPAMMTVGGSSFASNKTLSIGVGGAYGILMLLNVWGIIWPANKRILGALQGGPPAAPELARQAFIASRTNAWLSLPMLVFMGTSSHDWLIFSGGK
ncbi:MAG: hypothetical protein DMF71_05980 [Acidobacteria bacterium]|nr:MAG: hypothetical protein DMF71_05980 [Acidobacteriota bacterium]